MYIINSVLRADSLRSVTGLTQRRAIFPVNCGDGLVQIRLRSLEGNISIMVTGRRRDTRPTNMFVD
ncbi:hypothetical protein M404DRAFT_822941 [Pisolithus tinctorius Marx 270]|uniref:Uncharacterized protein n=1 Tax=Pisolithus tinctorius Marx 270 TaxID=870435 RepID=A0A0C3NUB3_PISTI|nr:hypothetical protein M404DRAFT_822941 [Pisolithus tinctorius Marx 270]